MEARIKAARAAYRGLLWGVGWRRELGCWSSSPPTPRRGSRARAGLTPLRQKPEEWGTQARPPPGEETRAATGVGDRAPPGQGGPCMASLGQRPMPRGKQGLGSRGAQGFWLCGEGGLVGGQAH